MVKSMTGYGRGEAVLHERTITVEVRSVNNRYLDCSIKMPRLYVFAEDAIKTRVQTSISRGKVDVFVSIDSSKADSVSVSVNRPVADGYYAALTELRDAYGLRDDLSVSLLSRFQDVLLVEKAQEDVETVAADICQVLDLALAQRALPTILASASMEALHELPDLLADMPACLELMAAPIAWPAL